MARLVPGAGEEAVRLGEAAGRLVVLEGAHLAVSVAPALGAGEQIGSGLIPEALVDGGHLALLLALVGEGGDDPAKGAVGVPADCVERAALKGCHDHVLVGGVHSDVHGIFAADVDGV